jgi:hypothetical protein
VPFACAPGDMRLRSTANEFSKYRDLQGITGNFLRKKFPTQQYQEVTISSREFVGPGSGISNDELSIENFPIKTPGNSVRTQLSILIFPNPAFAPTIARRKWATVKVGYAFEQQLPF